MKIPSAYTISKFYSFAEKPVQSRSYLNGGCPICREGKSWRRKKRLFYFIGDDYLFCHNCSKSWSPYFWIKEVTGMSFKEIKADIINYVGEELEYSEVILGKSIEESDFILPPLPGDCADLKDPLQLKYYSNYFILNRALSYCNERRLFTALNAPKTFFVCVKDNFHRNRLIIPYYDNNKIECYISRSLLDIDTKAKYLIKFNCDKPLFNISKVDPLFPYIFIFEGPIDCMFVKNGVSISGTTMTEEQENTLKTKFPFHKIIWCFDNFRREAKEVIEKIKKKLQDGEMIFMYDGDFSDFKDLNEFCQKKNLDFVNPDLIINSSYTGTVGLLKMS